MFNPFHFTSKCGPLPAHKKLLCAIALSGFTFAHATDYALVNKTASQQSVTNSYAVDLSTLTTPVDLLLLSSGNWTTTTGNITLDTLASTDVLWAVGANTFIIDSVSGIAVNPYTATFALTQGAAFNSTLKVDVLTTVDFSIQNFTLSLNSGSKLEGAGTVKFTNGSGTGEGTVASLADLSGFNGVLNIGANTTFEFQDTVTRTVSPAIAGSGTLRKTGLGQLTFNGNSYAYGGPVSLEAGTTILGANTSLGAGALTVKNGATLALGTNTLGNSQLTLIGSTLTSGANTYAGAVAVQGVGASTITVSSGSTLTLSEIVSGSSNLTLDGPGTVAFTNTANTYTGTVAVNSGTFSLSSTPTDGLGVTLSSSTLSLAENSQAKTFHTLTGSGTVNMGSGTVVVNNTAAQEVSALLQNTGAIAGSFRKEGAGILTVSNTNTFTGAAAVRGPVVFGASNALGIGQLFIESGGSVDLAGYGLGNTLVNFGSGGGKLENSSITTAVNYTGNIGNGSGILTQIGGAGDISFNGVDGQPKSTIGNSTGRITKIGTGKVTFGANSSVLSKLAISEGTVELKGTLGSGLTEATVVSAANFYIDGSNLWTRKVINGTGAEDGKLATISGAGTLHLRSGWIDLRTSAVTVANVNIHAADGEEPLARVMVDSTFNPTGGSITIDGILEAHIANSGTNFDVDYTLENTISGTGLLKKYGAGTLALTGDLTGFTGGVQVYEGTIRTGGTAFANALELYTGTTLISNLTNTAGTETALAGNLLGHLFTNDGLLHLGNNSTETQILSFAEFLNRGQGIYVNNYNYGHVRVNAQPAGEEFTTGYNSSWGSFFVPNGTLALNGKFLEPSGGVYSYNYAYAFNNGQISLDPGSVFEGTLVAANGGTIRLQGTNIDEKIHIHNINSSYKGIIDIGVDKINAEPSNMTVLVESLRMFHSGVIVLRPDVNAGEFDLPLLTINEDLYLPTGNYYSYYSLYFPNQASTTINILPTGTPANNDPFTIKLIQLSGDADTTENKAAIISYLKTGLLYDIDSAEFDQAGLLSCTLRYKQPAQLVSTATTSIPGLPDFYKRLAHSMLQQHSSDNDHSKYLYNRVANANSSFNMLDDLRSYSPAGAVPTAALYQPNISPQSNTLMRVHAQTALVTALMSKAPGFSTKGAAKEHPLFQKMFAHGVKETERYKKYAENNPGPHLESFRTVNLDGLSFESQLQYQHQKQPNRSADEIGYSSHSWTATLGASYSKKNHYSIGTLVSTTKNNEKMNVNEISKTGKKEDRLNTIGALGYYSLEQVPLIISGQLTYGQHNYDQTRTWSQRIALTNELLDMSAVADYKAYETTLQTEVGYTFTYSTLLALQPFVGATWSSTHNGAYQESSTTVSTGAANDYGYIVPDQSFSSAMYSAGIELVAMKKINDVESLIFARLGASTQKNSGETSEFRYAIIADPDAELTMSYQNYRYNTADILIGVYTTVAEGVTLTAVYNANIGKDIKKHNASLSVDYAF